MKILHLYTALPLTYVGSTELTNTVKTRMLELFLFSINYFVYDLPRSQAVVLERVLNENLAIRDSSILTKHKRCEFVKEVLALNT